MIKNLWYNGENSPTIVEKTVELVKRSHKTVSQAVPVSTKQMTTMNF